MTRFSPRRDGDAEHVTAGFFWPRYAPNRQQVRLFGLLFLLLGYSLAAGCGSPIYQQTIESDRYQIQLTLDGVGPGERTATIELRNKAGQPVDAEVLVLLPVMRDMGMASPEITATRTGIGRYEAKGELFSMDGAWEIDMRIGSGGSEETVSFPVTATQ